MEVEDFRVIHSGTRNLTRSLSLMFSNPIVQINPRLMKLVLISEKRIIYHNKNNKKKLGIKQYIILKKRC